MTCLAVSGQRATIGFLLDQDKSDSAEVSEVPWEGGYFALLDAGPSNSGRDAWQPYLTHDPYTCPAGNASDTVYSGDIKITDHVSADSPGHVEQPSIECGTAASGDQTSVALSKTQPAGRVIRTALARAGL